MNPSKTPTAETDILDIFVPEPPPNYWLMALWLGIAVLAITAIAWALLYFIRKDKLRRSRAASPRQVALSRLARLEGEANTMSPSEFGLRLSDIVKDYLHARFGDRFRFETAEEFLARANDARATVLPAPTSGALATFVGLCEELKFGRPGDAAERCAPLLDASRKIFHENPAPPVHGGVQSPPATGHASTSTAAS